MRAMSPTSEELRHQFVALSEGAAPQPGCPEPESLYDAARGGLPAAEVSGIIDHTSRCFVCAETWRLARELDTEGLLAKKAASRSTGFTSMTWLAAAAAITLAVSAGLFMLPLREETAPVMREGEEPTIHSLVPATEALSRSACVLTWSAVEAGARYSLQVGTQDLTFVAQARDLDQPRYTVPAKDLEKLPAEAILYWRVEATLPDGRRIASVTFINRLQ